jgi:cadmium resistance protein CadD (predicted permease)
MVDFFSLLGIGIGAFVASNIDDTFILIILFSTVSFRARHVFTGQFLGIAVLIIISALGSLIALVIPSFVIGLMGLIPIAIGVKRLIEFRHRDGTTKEAVQIKNSYLPFLAVASVTVSNGGDDIGVFTPLFAKYNHANEVTILITLFMAMTFVWCILTYYFVNHPIVASRVKRLGNILTPFVLIGLGIYILADAFFH